MDKIAFARPDVGELELKAARITLESGWLTSGPMVRDFEERVARISGAQRAVAVDSCTTALEFTLRLLNIGPGDEVITTPLTYTATADVILAVGARPVFVDTGMKSFEMDYTALEPAITSRTKAIIAVDYGGLICDYDIIIEIARALRRRFKPNGILQGRMERIAVIADAAHSFGASRNGKKSGSHADFTCFSFHVLKNITTGGEGGAICWSGTYPHIEESMEAHLRGLAHHFQTGKDPDNGWEYDVLAPGYNRPMTDINAAIGLVQIDRLSEITERRKALTAFYDQAFAGSNRIRPLIRHDGPDWQSAYHLYPVEVLPPDGVPSEEFRNRVILKMRDCGIQCNVHYKPLPMLTAYRRLGFYTKDYPNAYRKYSSLITLPYHTLLTGDQLDYIVQSLRKAVG